jgi:hypothetical protein
MVQLQLKLSLASLEVRLEQRHFSLLETFLLERVYKKG